MSNNDKIKLSAEIVVSVLSSSTANAEARLVWGIDYLEKFYNKIDELDKRYNDTPIVETDSPEVI